MKKITVSQFLEPRSNFIIRNSKLNREVILRATSAKGIDNYAETASNASRPASGYASIYLSWDSGVHYSNDAISADLVMTTLRREANNEV